MEAIAAAEVSDDDRHSRPFCYLRNDLNAARISDAKSSGSSHAAKCPPLSTSKTSNALSRSVVFSSALFPKRPEEIWCVLSRN
jgi:hypothetical protein